MMLAITMQQQNKTLIQFFEWYCPADGGHWNRFAQAVPSLRDMGITAAWLPPNGRWVKASIDHWRMAALPEALRRDLDSAPARRKGRSRQPSWSLGQRLRPGLIATISVQSAAWPHGRRSAPSAQMQTPMTLLAPDTLADFMPRRIALQGATKVVHVGGTGPAVIVMTAPGRRSQASCGGDDRHA